MPSAVSCKLEVLIVRVLNTGTKDTTGIAENTDATVDDWSLVMSVCLFVREG